MRHSLFDLDPFLATDKGFVDLNNAANATHRRKFARAHGLTNAMGKEPSGFHAARKHPLDLIGRDAFLACAHQVNNLEPKAQGQVRTFKNGSLTNSKLATTFIAIVKAKASGLALHLANAVRIGVAAMRANRPIGPKFALDIRESGSFVVEPAIIKSGLGYGGLSYCRDRTPRDVLCQV